jgi:hypothetical protein
MGAVGKEVLMFPMLPWPDPQDVDEPCPFRLPGFAGAAVFLRRVVLPGSPGRLAVDLALLTPDWHGWYLARPVGEGFVTRLAAFLFAAASDFHPELSVSAFTDESVGLVVSVTASTDSVVELEWVVLADPADTLDSRETLRFETSRVALVTSSVAARSLDGSVDESTIEEFTP